MEIKQPIIEKYAGVDLFNPTADRSYIDYKYSSRGVFSSEGTRHCSCENCGQTIAWYVVLVEKAKNQNGTHNIIRVGVDCGRKLSEARVITKKFGRAKKNKQKSNKVSNL